MINSRSPRDINTLNIAVPTLLEEKPLIAPATAETPTPPKVP